MPGIHNLLIANRGEIAVRLIRACRELGVRAVAVYSDADAGALHVRLADAAVNIGPPAPRESYLNIDRLITAAHAAAADAVHPGYGFLSENADFAEAVQSAGLAWVGPPSAAIRAMGSKTGARALMQSAGVPVVPGYDGDGGRWAEAAHAIGYPVLVKASGGGGGRGMRVVAEPSELEAALASARREAFNAFGDDRIFIEKYIARGRHIEFQVFGDSQGNVLHLFERECSVQRRHQKLIEESPSPLLAAHPALREQMGAAAVRAARAVGYQNAGTVEFIVDPDTLAFYFLEMNTRLQVEHPVTEMVTGLDLVHLQLLVAAGQPLPFAQADLSQRGHALECRIYAEDPAHAFYPSVGTLHQVVIPQAPGVRADTGFGSGDTVTEHYDALLAKVIVHAPTRAAALTRMQSALARFHLLGIITNLAFLRALLAHPELDSGRVTTRFVEEHFAGWQPPAAPAEALIAAALADHLSAAPANGRGPMTNVEYDPWAALDGFRLGGQPGS